MIVVNIFNKDFKYTYINRCLQILNISNNQKLLKENS